MDEGLNYISNNDALHQMLLRKNQTPGGSVEP